MILKKGSLKKLPALLKVTFFNTLHTLPITVACMAVATLTANAIFHLSGNAINVSIIYILAILLHARYTKCYSAGIIASLYSVFWVNYAYTYPYMTLNFTLSGYPLTFVGMTFISCFTSSICIMLSKQSVQIQEKDRMLMQAEKETMRANLLRAMSHDLRTPLTTIIGSSAAYLEQENEMSPEEKRKLIHNIEEDAQWLLNMVENLLSVTRIQDDKGITSVTKTDESLEEVISEAVRRFHKRFPGVTVQVHIPESFIMVPMDAMLIEQVINNLLENAHFHSGSEKPVAYKDDKHILFTANIAPSAEDAGFPSGQFQQIYEVAVTGGRPTMFSSMPMECISINKEGVMLYQDKKGYEDYWRKHQVSPIARDIWSYTPG